MGVPASPEVLLTLRLHRFLDLCFHGIEVERGWVLHRWLVQHLTLIINGAPEVHARAANHGYHLDQVLLLTRARPATPQIAGIDLTELEHPAPDRLVRDVEAAFR